MLILIRLDGTKCVHVFRETLFFFKQQTLSTPTNRDKSKLSAYQFQLVLESVEESALFQICQAVAMPKECFFSDVPLFSC